MLIFLPFRWVPLTCKAHLLNMAFGLFVIFFGSELWALIVNFFLFCFLLGIFTLIRLYFVVYLAPFDFVFLFPLGTFSLSDHFDLL